MAKSFKTILTLSGILFNKTLTTQDVMDLTEIARANFAEDYP